MAEARFLTEPDEINIGGPGLAHYDEPVELRGMPTSRILSHPSINRKGSAFARFYLPQGGRVKVRGSPESLISVLGGMMKSHVRE